MKLRCLTYNIHKGMNIFGTRFVLKAIKESLRLTGADILFLQEVVGFHEEQKRSQFEFLADQVWRHFSYGKNAAGPTRHHGNAILSKFPILFQENLDISTNTYEKRGLLHCVIEVPKVGEKSATKIHLFNTHIDLLASGRRKQIQKIRDRIFSHANKEALIFTGDFNDWSEDVGPWLEEKALNLLEAHTEVFGEPAKTFPSFLPFLPLDRVYYRGLKAKNCECLEQSPWNRLSDHLPVMVDFEL